MNKLNQEKSKNKSIVLGIILLLLIMITLLGIAYGYYRTRVIGNSEMESIKNPSKLLKVVYEDDNPEVVTDPLYGPGRTVKKDFKVRNVGDDTGNYSIILDDIENTLERTWDIRYTLKDKITDEVLVKGTLGSELKKQMVYADISIGVEELDEYTLELEYEETNEDQSIDMGKRISFKIDIIEAHENIFEDIAGENTLLYAIGRDNEVVNPLTIPGQQTSTTEEAELSYTEDDYGTSYYFRGNVQNNYVTFAGMCWRVVRVLGNGNIELVLASETGPCTKENITETSALILDLSARNSYLRAPLEEHGFENSNLHSGLNNWYNNKSEIATLKDLVEEAEWCNDLSVAELDGEKIIFNGYKRVFLVSSASPSLKCNFQNKVELEPYKALKVKSKIAVLTADEFAFAGLVYNISRSSSYLQFNSNGKSLTMTPSSYRQFFFSNNSVIQTTQHNNPFYARPSIVVSSTALISSGNGTLDNPYIILETNE